MCVICAYMYVIHLCRTISVWLHSLISVRQHFALVKLLANLCSVAQGLSYLNGGIFQGNRKTKIPVSISDFELNLKLNQKKKGEITLRFEGEEPNQGNQPRAPPTRTPCRRRRRGRWGGAAPPERVAGEPPHRTAGEVGGSH